MGSVSVDGEDIASKASEAVEPLSDDCYTKPVEISESRRSVLFGCVVNSEFCV